MTTRPLRGDELAVDIDEDRTRQMAGVVFLATTARLAQEPSDIGEAEARIGQTVAQLRGGDEHGPEDTASAETAVARSSYPSRQCQYVPRDDMLRPAARTASVLMATLLIAACSSGGGSGTTAPSASSAPSAAASSAARIERRTIERRPEWLRRGQRLSRGQWLRRRRRRRIRDQDGDGRRHHRLVPSNTPNE